MRKLKFMKHTITQPILDRIPHHDLRDERHKSPILEGIITEFENPIVEKVEDVPSLRLTKKKHIRELQRILVQTCIDFIRQKGLTDIYSVHFSADELDYSAQFGEWQSATDSYIRVNGIRLEKHRRKNGEITTIYNTYVIGENM